MDGQADHALAHGCSLQRLPQAISDRARTASGLMMIGAGALSPYLIRRPCGRATDLGGADLEPHAFGG